jgi:putative acyl-CoA dehydrogenase
MLSISSGDGYSARDLTERLALALQASLLMRQSSSAISDAFIASRLAGQHGQAFGTLPGESDVKGILSSVTESLATQA